MSVFLSIPPERWVASNVLAFAIRDAFPVSEGHTLVIPRRCVASWFEATEAERAALLALVDEVKAALDQQLRPDGYNLGINDGAAAGQTVPHLHIHLIPRFDGDVDDPSGGVRFVVPSRGDYRSPGRLPVPRCETASWPHSPPPPPRQLATGGIDDPFVHHLRPALQHANEVHILAAFVQGSGVEHLAQDIAVALDRGVRFRVLTGDYLHITQAHALRRLLDWSQAAQSDDREGAGAFSVRVVESRALGGRAFHPKSWRIEGPSVATAWVGSANWSRSALTTGVEWNLRVDRDQRPDAYAEIVAAFEALWEAARPLDAPWLEAYAVRAPSASLPVGEIEDVEPAPPPAPRGLQAEALAALARGRQQGRHRALVVLATGLGKTFLAAFDVRARAAALGRTPRLLFVAHRRELLLQAATTFRRVFPDASFGLFVGNADQLDTHFVFASVQKLARPEHLARLAPDAFDYVVVDESHHAAADSYRRVLARLSPGFLLGLTATPERADDADVAELFDDHVAYRAGLAEGIAADQLVPFHYLGLRDTIGYQPLPWRSYTVEQLTALAATEARMAKLWEAWVAHPGTRTLVFCVSIDHADYVADWLRSHDVRAEAVHTGPRSADRTEVLEQLDSGALQAAVAVDLFNEGIDVPRVDRVVMLRPTESPVVFLQQLGRGLRCADGKERLVAIDFVGNHRVFLDRLRTLLSLSPDPPSLRRFFDAPAALELPAGCTIDIELEAIDLLSKLLPPSSGNATVRAYRELREARGTRPTPGELVRRGLSPASVRKEHGSWYAFVDSEGDLDAPEQQALQVGQQWLADLERTPTNRSQQMVVLEALLAADALFEGMALDRLADASHALLCRNPELFADLEGVRELPDPRSPDRAVWRRYWHDNPVAAWTGGKHAWFWVDDGVFRFRLSPPRQPAVRDALERLTRHIVDWRLAAYRRRNTADDGGSSSFVCEVGHNQRDPILFLPTTGRDALPRGAIDVHLDDGALWSFRFVKIAVNVAAPVGSDRNQLPELLRRWFGPDAGLSGTDHRVRFSRSPEGWWIAPTGGAGAHAALHAADRTGPAELPPGAHVEDIASAFGVRGAPVAPWSRRDGHLFVLVERPDVLIEPDRVDCEVPDLGPTETAHVLTKTERGWRYAGVGRWLEGQWHIPAVDFATWRAWGRGRSASRRLDARFEETARSFAQRLAQQVPGTWLEGRGRRCRLVGSAARGGVRIDGGPGGFGVRTVSSIDLAWVLAAREDVQQHGGVLDEARVNRLRYLDGTPRGSTRYIDTGWALVLLAASDAPNAEGRAGPRRS